MKGWCVTCQLRTGKVHRIEVVLFDEPCPNARPGEPPHLVHVDLPLMYTSSRPVVLLDLSAI